MSDEIVKVLQDDPIVKEIHVNGIATMNQNSCDEVQSEVPSWGLPRTSHFGGVTNGLPDSYTYSEENSGQMVFAYILDTGIFIDHPDIAGRAIWGHNSVPGSADTDRNGHGTHIAGTVAGSTFGIAKSATLVAVKVLGDTGSGSYAMIIDGLQWTVTDFMNRKAQGALGVVNMAFGGSTPGGMEAAIKAGFDEGLPFVAGAGNSNTNSCTAYPVGFKDLVIGVAGTEEDDVCSPSSNYGVCISLYAPGVGITSIWWNGSTQVLSGNSMAAAHVTGQAAVLLSTRPYNPIQLELELQADAQIGLLTNVGQGSPNLLLYNGC